MSRSNRGVSATGSMHGPVGALAWFKSNLPPQLSLAYEALLNMVVNKFAMHIGQVVARR